MIGTTVVGARITRPSIPTTVGVTCGYAATAEVARQPLSTITSPPTVKIASDYVRLCRYGEWCKISSKL